MQSIAEVKKIAKVINSLFGNGDINITVSGKEAYTSSGQINIPMLDFTDPIAVTMTHGYIDHECGHESDTEQSFLLKAQNQFGLFGVSVLNALEDARMEDVRATLYPGTRINLMFTWDLATERGLLQDPDHIENVAELIFSYILNHVRFFVNGYTTYSAKAFTLLNQHFDRPFLDELTALIESNARSKSTSDCFDITAKIVKLLKQEQQKRDSQSNDDSDSDSEDEADGQSDDDATVDSDDEAEAQPDDDATADSDGEAEAQPDDDATADSDGETEAQPDDDATADSDGEAEAQPDDDATADSDGEAEAQPDDDATADSDGEAEAQPDDDATADSDDEADGQSDDDATADSDDEADGQSDDDVTADSEDEAEVQPDDDATADSEDEAEAQPDDDAKADSDDKAEVQPDDDATADSEHEAEAQPDDDSTADSDGEAEAQPDDDSTADSDGQAEAQPDDDATADSDGQADGQSDDDATADSDGEAEAQPDDDATADLDHESTFNTNNIQTSPLGSPITLTQNDNSHLDNASPILDLTSPIDQLPNEQNYHAEIELLLNELANDYQHTEDPLSVNFQFADEQIARTKHPDDWKPLAATFARTLQRVLIDNSEHLKYPSVHGRQLMGSKLSSIACGNDVVFEQKEQFDAPTSSVYFLVDASGSMDGALMQEANKTALAFAKAFQKLSIDIEVTYFGCQGQTTDSDKLYCAKQYGKKLNPDRFNISGFGNTPTEDGLMYALIRIINQPSDNKIIFVVTDGDPNNPHLVTKAENLICQAGIKLIPIGLGTNKVKGLNNPVFAEDSQAVNQALKDAIKLKLFD